jgi:predicted ATP-binding protein involved in virulence
MTDLDNNPKKNKAIRILEGKAEDDDLKALFQLGEYYQAGKFVKKSPKKAEVFFDRALDVFYKSNLSLKSLKLFNFCGFEDASLDFSNKKNSNSKKLTVLVGNNGTGKTSILISIVKCLGWLTGAIRSKDGKGFHIQPLEINNKEEINSATIISEFLLNSNDRYEVQLSKSKEGSISLTKSNFTEIRLLGEMYQLASSKDKKFSLPLMAFYPVARAIDVTSKDIEQVRTITNQESWGKMDGYNDALTHSGSFKLFFQWFRHFDDIVNSSSTKTKKLNVSIDKLKTELNLLKSMDKTSEGNELINSLINEKETEYKRLRKSSVKDVVSSPKKILEHVIKAIQVFMPELSNLRIERSPRVEMFVDKNEFELNVLQLSQGEKSLMALVADIARRLVLLNPSLIDPLDGGGIVLIDEVDLHLHPEWQQSVLTNLTSTFPNIQFIVSTHSPQVLSTVYKESIRILNSKGIQRTHISTFGEESKTILEDVMNVDSRPKSSMSKKLKNYLEKLNVGDIDSEEVKAARVKLESYYGSDYSQFRLADMVINKWKAVRNKMSEK